MKEKEKKELVRQTYGNLAMQGRENESRCCCSKPKVYTIMSDSYKDMAGYHPNADMGLGCGLPTHFAKIKKGDTVIDLGSGAGNDCFIAREETGETGKVIGIDFTPAMIEKARKNAKSRGLNNVEFIEGDIEYMPVTDTVADVIISNCVLNLVPNKKAVFADMYRVLKPGGHFSISDIVLTGHLPEKLRTPAEMYAGCVASAIQKSEYLGYIAEAGFINITIQKEKPIIIPDDLLRHYFTEEEISAYKADTTVIFSITVYGEKPAEVHSV